MAASSEKLRKEYECPVHLELLREPMILKCLHRLCKEDVDRMTDGGVIQCPTCNAVSDIDDVKRDFNAQAVLDIVCAQDDNDTATSQDRMCGACNKAQATAKCHTCDMYLDPDCALGHSRIKFSEPHRIETFATIQERKRGELRAKVDLLTSTMSCFDDVTQSVQQYERKIAENKLVTQRKLEALHERLKLSLVKKFASLSASVESEADESIAGCREARAKISASKQAVDEQRNALSDAVNSEEDGLLHDDYVTQLVSQSESVAQSFDQVVLDVNHLWPAECEWILPEIVGVIKEVESLDVRPANHKPAAAAVAAAGYKPHPAPRVEAATSTSEEQIKPAEFQLTSLLDRPVAVTERFRFQKNVWNIKRVGDEIWVIHDDRDVTVLQYTTDRFAILRTIRVWQKVPPLEAAARFVLMAPMQIRYQLCAVMRTRYGIIGACQYLNNKNVRPAYVPPSRDLGLVVLYPDGCVKTVIASGPYHHVEAVNTVVCGLIDVNGRCKLTLHTQQRDQWMQLKEIHYDRAFDSVFASRDYLYFNSFNDSCIHRKKLDDEQFNELFAVPYVCLVDHYMLYINCGDVNGNVLVTDQRNNKVVVFRLADDPPQARLVQTSRQLNAPGIGFEISNEVLFLEDSSKIVSLELKPALKTDDACD